MPRRRKPQILGAPVDPRGGPRSGSPGRSYPNRSDLAAQPVRTVTNQTYGEAGAQAAAQRAVPLAGQAQIPTGPPRAFATPDDTPNLFDPTGRPDEPLEAGLPFGPGPGPGLLSGSPINDTANRLRALYLAHPSQELLELIEEADL